MTDDADLFKVGKDDLVFEKKKHYQTFENIREV